MLSVLPYIYNIGPTSYHSFIGCRDITGDGERGGGGEEQERWNCLRSSVNILIERGNMRAVLPYIYMIMPLPTCSTTGKPMRSFATERVSLDSV